MEFECKEEHTYNVQAGYLPAMQSTNSSRIKPESVCEVEYSKEIQFRVKLNRNLYFSTS